MKTVLITGCSSGFGLEIARYFLARDWQVVATMRTPRADVLPPSERLRVLALDVTNPESIRETVEAAGPIDVLVNNAGFGAASPAELVPIATVREIFETNTFGTIALTQAVLPQFRQRRAGVDRERHVECDAEGAASACRVPREQGGGERIHRVDGAGARAVRRACAPGAAGPCARHPLRRQRARPYARPRPRGLCRSRQGGLRAAGGYVCPDHPGTGRRRSRVARGDRSVIADAHPGRRRRRSLGGRGSLAHVGNSRKGSGLSSGSPSTCNCAHHTLAWYLSRWSTSMRAGSGSVSKLRAMINSGRSDHGSSSSTTRNGAECIYGVTLPLGSTPMPRPALTMLRTPSKLVTSMRTRSRLPARSAAARHNFEIDVPYGMLTKSSSSASAKVMLARAASR